MAKMYPFAQPSPTESEAEKMLYWQFKKQLSDDYTVIHSLPWLKSAIRSLAEKEYVKNTPTGEVDFLILHPKLGILAIEVKGGAYKYSDHSFVSIKRDEKVDVIGQIRRNTHGLARWIGNQPTLRIRFGYAVAFPDSSFLEKKLPPGLKDGAGIDTAETVIGKEDVPILGDKIARLMGFWKAALRTHDLGEEKLQSIVDLVCPEAFYTPTWDTRISFDNTLWLCLSSQQQQCISRIDESKRMVVKGWPGTGKTLLAIEAVKRISARKEKSLVITYNVNMANHIRAQLSDHSKYVDVFHFHDLCRKAASSARIVIDVDGDASRTYAKVLTSGFSSGYFDKYDAIVIDEGQALCQEWHEAIAQGFSQKFALVFCDDAQIFAFEDGSDSYQVCHIYGVRESFVLTQCLRSPSAVNKKLQEIYPPNFDIYCPRPYEEDSLTEIVTDKPMEELRNQVRNLVEHQNVSPHDIVITYPYTDILEGLDREDPLNEIVRINVAKFRGLEAPVVIFFGDDARDSTVFCAYSRATTRCIAIFNYLCVNSPSEGTYAYKLAEQKREVVESIRDRRSVSIRFSTMRTSARKLNITTANIYWFDKWNGWVVETLEDRPAGKLWIDCLSTLDWPIYSWDERHSIYIRRNLGSQSLYEDETAGGQFELLHCDSCNCFTLHKGVLPPLTCWPCATTSSPSLPPPSQSDINKLESFEATVVQNIQGNRSVNPQLPISLVALGLYLFTTKREATKSTEILTTGGRIAYRAAYAIVASNLILQGKKMQDLDALANKYYDSYSSLANGGLDRRTWRSVVANAVSVLGKRGLLIKDPIRKGYFYGSE